MKQQQHCIQKATEDCKLVCDVIAPNNGQQLFGAMASSSQGSLYDTTRVDDLVEALLSAYKNAENRYTKTQIRSFVCVQVFCQHLKENSFALRKIVDAPNTPSKNPCKNRKTRHCTGKEEIPS